jgi:hypothetical protein
MPTEENDTEKWCVFFIDLFNNANLEKRITAQLKKQTYLRLHWYRFCYDGDVRDLWNCPDKSFAENFKHYSDAMGYECKIYVQQKGNVGAIRRWPLDSAEDEAPSEEEGKHQ